MDEGKPLLSVWARSKARYNRGYIATPTGHGRGLGGALQDGLGCGAHGPFSSMGFDGDRDARRCRPIGDGGPGVESNGLTELEIRYGSKKT